MCEECKRLKTENFFLRNSLERQGKTMIKTVKYIRAATEMSVAYMNLCVWVESAVDVIDRASVALETR